MQYDMQVKIDENYEKASLAAKWSFNITDYQAKYKSCVDVMIDG